MAAGTLPPPSHDTRPLGTAADPPTPRARAAAAWRRVPGWLLPAGLLAALTALAAFLHLRELGAPFWIDEGISVGIAHHDVGGIFHALRQDGAPPLYYLLLHGWMAVFGDSERSVHALSAVPAILSVPAAWWAARATFGPRGALLAAALVAFNPFVGLYADEARMYTLVFLLATLATGALLRGLLLRDRRSLVLFCVFLTALLYTHNWAFFFFAACGLVIVGWAALHRDRRMLLEGIAALAAAVVAFLPWVPTVLFQARHTGAPWSHRPTFASLGRALRELAGGRTPYTVLAIVAVGGLISLVMARGRPVAGRQVRDATLVAAVMAAATLLLAWGYSQAGSPAWALRYLAVVLAPLVLAVAGGLSASGPTGPLAVVVLCWVFWWGQPSTTSLIRKSNVNQLADAMGPHLRPGDVVLSLQPEQVPVLRYYLGPRGVSYRTPIGAVADDRVSDWVDALPRLQAARYAKDLAPTIRALAPGRRLLVVQPRFRRPDAPWTRQIATITANWSEALGQEATLRRVARVRPPSHGQNRSALSAILYERRR